MADVEGAAGAVGEQLTKKIGPLPVWVWGLVAVGGVVLVTRLGAVKQAPNTQLAAVGGPDGGNAGGSSGGGGSDAASAIAGLDQRYSEGLANLGQQIAAALQTQQEQFASYQQQQSQIIQDLQNSFASSVAGLKAAGLPVPTVTSGGGGGVGGGASYDGNPYEGSAPVNYQNQPANNGLPVLTPGQIVIVPNPSYLDPAARDALTQHNEDVAAGRG